MWGIAKFLVIGLLVLATGGRLSLLASSNTFLDYQNYNHGYCPDCQCAPCSCHAHEGAEAGPPPPPPVPAKKCKTPNPCSPPATTAATECGVNLWLIGIGIAVLVIAAKFVVSSNNGHNVHP